MKLHVLFLLLVLTTQLQAQDPNWEFIRSDNTGIGGQSHFVIRGDDFNNIWTGGYTSSSEEGSLVRISEDVVYTNWGTYAENFLPNGIIYDIDFDSTGIIWVGTQGGIATSSDGFVWDHYDNGNSALLANRIRAIDTDSNDEPWVVQVNEDNSLYAIAHFNGSLWENFTTANSGMPVISQLNDILVDTNDTKWIASDIGLISYDGSIWTLYDTTNSDLSSNNVLELGSNDQNEIWAFVGDAIDIFDGSNWTQINSDDWPISNFNGSSMYVNNGNIVLSEGGNSRVLMYNGTTWQSEILNFSIYDNFVDENGIFWISGFGVIAKYDGMNWTRFTRNNTGLPDNFNNDIFIDSQDRRWFANGGGGIQVFDCPKWEVYGPNNEGLFPNPQPLFQTTIGTSITEDADGDIWFTYDGTSGYAIQIPGGTYQDYAAWVIWDNTNALPALQSLKEIEATDDGKVFIRGFNINTFMYDKVLDTWTLWDLTNGLTSSPNCLTANGTKMYLGHYQGIDVYDNGNWSRIDLAGEGIEHVKDIKFDANGNMWIGTSDGLFMFDGTTWTNWNVDNSNIAANNITEIVIDNSNGRIYISAHNTQIFPYYGGISYFDGTGNTFTTFKAADSPLAHKQVEDIALDSIGNLWALTQSEGFSIYNPNGISGFGCIDRSLQRSGTLGMNDLEGLGFKNGFISPNPVKDNTTLYVNLSNDEPLKMSLYDVLGREVQSKVFEDLVIGENKLQIDLNNQQTGVYFCKLTSSSVNSTIKLIKK